MPQAPSPIAAVEAPAAARSGSGLRLIAAAELRAASLRWAIGGFCVLVGTLMCVVPHQFSSPSFDLIRTFLPWAGNVYLAAGVAMISVAALQPRRALAAAAHVFAGGALLFYALMLLSTATWGGWPVYLALGLSTLGAALLPSTDSRPLAAPGGDLFALAIGVCAICSGAVMLALPGQYHLSIYDLIRPHLRWFGLAFLASGALLALVHLWGGRPRALYWPAHLALAASFFGYMALVSVPSGGITGIVFYGGFGSLVALLPRLAPALGQIDARSLKLRQALTLGAAAALPLTLTVTAITDQQERIALEQTLAEQQRLATVEAQSLGAAVLSYRAAVAALGTQLAAAEPAAHDALLATFQPVYPTLSACATRSAAELRRAAPGLDSVLPTGQPALALHTPGGTPTLLIGAPAGAEVLTCELGLADLMERAAIYERMPGLTVYVVDEAGRELTRAEGAAGLLADRSAEPPVRAVRGGEPGSVRFGEPSQYTLAGYAPVPGLGWGVVVQRQASGALASIRVARELALAMLLAVVALGMGVGVVVARRMAAPLSTLAAAVDRFTGGDPSAPLPAEAPSEIARLTSAFQQMRDQVTASVAEREEAIRLRDTLFSVAAHELKTPLTSLLGQAQLLQRRAAREGTLGERDTRSLAVLADQGLRLNKLVTSLLDVSRLREGRLAIERAPVDLAALVDRVVAELQPTLDHHQLVRTGAAGPLLIAADDLRLEQVLHNLIGNAVKYSPAGGEVRIDVARGVGEARIAVADRGIGIPSTALPRLFRPFYRAPNADHGQIGGMGIGLYVVNEIIALHGGQVMVESVENVGSTFTVVLPLTP